MVVARQQAARRGATVIVAHPRPTRLDADATFRLRFEHGRSVDAVLELARKLPENLKLPGSYAEAADAISAAGELVVFFGGEGLGFRG